MVTDRRRYRVARLACVALLAGVSVVPLGARAAKERPDAAERALLSAADDERLERFRVVIGGVLAEPALPLSDTSLASVSRLIFDAVSDLSERVPLPGESEARIRALVMQQHAERLSEHADRTAGDARNALEAADSTLAAPEAPPPRPVGGATTIDPVALGLSDRVDLEIVLPDIQLRPTSAPAALAASAARATEADLYLYTIARAATDLVFLEIRAYHVAFDRDRRVFAGATTVEGLSALVAQAGPAIVAALAGGPRATLVVTVPAPDGDLRTDVAVYVDDRLLGIGGGRIAYLLPGRHEIRAELIDGREVRRTVMLADDQERVIEIEAPPRTPNAVVIDSVPRGATVYRNALWLGTTPLRVPAAASEQIYTLQLADHYDARLVIGPAASGRITRAMVPLTANWGEQVQAQRKAFYRAFGFFAVSVAGPLITFAEYDNRASINPTAAQPFLYGYYGSLGLSGALFAHMLWRLTRYIDTAEGYHVR